MIKNRKNVRYAESCIREKFSGYIDIGKYTFSFFVSGHEVSLLPAYSEHSLIYDALNAINKNNNCEEEFLFGHETGTPIALFRNDHYMVFPEWDYAAKFSPPMIIKSTNTERYDKKLNNEWRINRDWRTFDAITFYGGIINSIFPPRSLLKAGTQTESTSAINLNEPSEFTYEVEFKIPSNARNQLNSGSDTTYSKGKFIVSIAYDCYMNDLCKLNVDCFGDLFSYISLRFESPQPFIKIIDYYTTIKSLISILVGQTNIQFNVALEQLDLDDEYFKTADCKVFDKYENYSNKDHFHVIKVNRIIDFIPNIFNIITREEADVIFRLLPDNNRNVNLISIHNIQDMCTALELSYKWKFNENDDCETNDEYIKGLRSAIKEAVKKYDKETAKDSNQITTVGNCFKHLDYTAKNRIMTLCKENASLFKRVYYKNFPCDNEIYEITKDDEKMIKTFVTLRNNQTHSGMGSWEGCERIYYSLLAIVYVSFFQKIGMSAEYATNIVLELF